MKTKLILFLLFLVFFAGTSAQENYVETIWDMGVPVMDDQHVSDLIVKLNPDSLIKLEEIKDKKRARMCYEIATAFKKKHMYEGADWYFRKIPNYKPDDVEKEQEIKKQELVELQNKSEAMSSTLENLSKDQKFLSNLPKSYDNISKDDMKNLLKKIESQIISLTRERDSLIKNKSDEMLIKTKESSITTLKKEKKIVKLSILKVDLVEQKALYKKYLIWSLIGLSILVLAIIVLLQRKTIKIQDGEIAKQLKDIEKKNTYLEHAASLIRHDMHSGINTYIPRGLTSLEKRITSEQIKELKIESPLKMIKEGLFHTQKVYKKVHEFTSLVKQDAVLEKSLFDLKDLINQHLENTTFKDQVEIGDLTKKEVNDTLFCLAIENLIKNGIKSNKDENKKVSIFMEDNNLIIQDNGFGMTKKEFEKLKSSYIVVISSAILSEMGFELIPEKNDLGTKMKIKLN